MKWDGTHKTIADWIRNPDTLFFLTKDESIEIFHSDNDWEYELLHYGNQCRGIGKKEETDEFGRNYTDRLFVRLCLLVYVKSRKIFRSLSCRKVDERYIARVELSDETLEMELSEMVALFEERCRKT
jgi:hypothetical protein